MTEQDKQDKKALLQLEKFSKAIRINFSFGKIKTYRDLLKSVGYSDELIKEKYFDNELNRAVTFKDIQEFLSDKKIELTTTQWLRRNPPIIKHEETAEQTTDSSSNKSEIFNNKPDEIVDKTVATPDRQIRVVTEEEPKTKEVFMKSPNESPEIFFFWFQKDAIMKMLNGILKGE